MNIPESQHRRQFPTPTTPSLQCCCHRILLEKNSPIFMAPIGTYGFVAGSEISLQISCTLGLSNRFQQGRPVGEIMKS